jgi:hypothetical protein
LSEKKIMKKQLFTMCAMMAVMTAGAQTAYDAERLFGSELNGTARFVGMGGAMSALGGDISVIGTNPAGLGIFRSNDVSMSFGFNNTSAEGTFNGTTMNEDRTRASFDQIGFVYSNKIGNQTSLRYVNFGFNYHKSKNFNKLFSMGGALNGLSQSWQLSETMNNYGLTSSEFDNILDGSNPYQTYWNQLPVLGVMGVRTGVVDWYNGQPMGWDGSRNNFYSRETGGINEYDFSVGLNLEDRVYLGLTFGAYDVNYDRYTSYTEDLLDDNAADNGGYTLDNTYRLDGTGFDVKFGAIVRPIEDSPFRIGLAVHTPTWYDLTEYYNAQLSSDIYAYDGAYSQNLGDFLNGQYRSYDYRLVTPWKFNVSAGTTVSGLLALDAEYEYSDYSSGKLKDVDGYELDGTYDINDFLKGVHTVRVGMDARLDPQFSVRAGYNYTSAAYRSDAYAALPVYGTSTQFCNSKNKNTVTVGLGYRGSVVYADLAYKYDLYKSDFYAFDDIDLPATKVDNSRHQLLFTLGAKF